MNPTVSEKILRADSLGTELQKLLNDRSIVIKTERDELCLLYWSLVVDHHSGILLLLHKENHAPAFALVRPMVEAFLRLHLAIHGTERQLAALKNGTYQTDFGAIGDDIDKRYGLDPPFLGAWFRNGAASVLHGFTHGGLEQLLRHKAAGEIRPNFSDSDILEAITLTSMIAYLTVLAIAELLEFPDEFDRALKIYAAYRQKTALISVQP